MYFEIFQKFFIIYTWIFKISSISSITIDCDPSNARMEFLEAPVWNITIKFCYSREHSLHTFYIGSIPLWNIAIKFYSSRKHLSHIIYITRIPVWNIAIKFCSSSKHSCHKGYITCIPFWDIPIEIFCFSKHRKHISYITCVHIWMKVNFWGFYLIKKIICSIWKFDIFFKKNLYVFCIILSQF